MKYTAEMGLGGMIYIPSIMMMGSDNQYSSTASTFCEVSVLVLLMGEIYEVCFEMASCGMIHITFHDD
jgi:hypothetical protein